MSIVQNFLCLFLQCSKSCFLTCNHLFGRTGGNSWSTGPAPPPPPGVHHRHPSGEDNKSEAGQKSVLNAVIIVVSCLGALLVVSLLIAVFSRRRSPPPSSHFLDEERISGRKGFTPLQSQELRPESYVAILKDPKGILLFVVSACRNNK